MSPRQKAVGYLTFLIVLAAIAGMLMFVSKPVMSKLRPVPTENDHIRRVDSGWSIAEYRDDEHHVTCWTGGGGIACLRDVP